MPISARKRRRRSTSRGWKNDKPLTNAYRKTRPRFANIAIKDAKPFSQQSLESRFRRLKQPIHFSCNFRAVRVRHLPMRDDVIRNTKTSSPEPDTPNQFFLGYGGLSGTNVGALDYCCRRAAARPPTPPSGSFVEYRNKPRPPRRLGLFLMLPQGMAHPPPHWLRLVQKGAPLLLKTDQRGRKGASTLAFGAGRFPSLVAGFENSSGRIRISGTKYGVSGSCSRRSHLPPVHRARLRQWRS